MKISHLLLFCFLILLGTPPVKADLPLTTTGTTERIGKEDYFHVLDDIYKKTNEEITFILQPESHEVCEGSTISLLVEVTNPCELNYQWFKDGEEIEGETSASFEITSANNGGNYYVVVSGDCGSKTSETAVITVKKQPVITAQPTAATICTGNTHSFSVTASHAQGYQWYKNNEEITGATASTYTASSAGTYKVEVQGHSDCTPEFVTSEQVDLTVNHNLSIAAASESQTVCEGQQVILFVEPNASSQTIQWYKNGALTTYTGGSLTVTAPQDGDVFYAKVTGLCNVVASDEMVITVKKQPVITAQPTSATICTGSTHTFSVTATNAQGYQWYKNNEEITGATASTYTASSAGSYKVEVQGHSDCTPGFVTSSEVDLTVNQTLSIAAASESQTVCEGQQVILFVEPNASSQTIQWYKNGALTTYTGGSLTVTAPQDGDVYYAKVTGLCNVVNSGEMVITVKKQPVITAQPTAATICTGSTHTFSVTATNAQGYQWYKKNEEITGATASTYTTSESGTYKVEVQGHSDCTPEFVTSEQVDLTVNQTLSIAAASESQTVCEGQQVILFVEPTRSSQSIEWYKNGDLTTYTGGSLTVTTPQDGDVFYAKVTGLCNVVNSGEMVITVKKQPVITAQPTAATICTGSTHSFSVTATHAQGYQWYKNNEEITGATASTYTTSESGTYKVEVKGHSDCTPEFVTSSEVDLTVNQTLSIAAASESQTICEGQQVILFVEPTGSSQTIEWYKNGALTAYTGGSLTVNNPQDSDVYYAKVTGLCNVVNSGEMVITVKKQPVITAQPTSATICTGSTHTFSVTATNAQGYQWYKNNEEITGATASTYTTSESGTYKVEVQGHSDCTPEFVTSSEVHLTVNQTLSIAAASESQTVCEGQQVILFVEPNASSQSIEWYKNGALTTYTGGSLTVSTPQDGDIFYAKVTGLCNVVASDEMVITVKKQPVISAQPISATICTGNTHTFSVTATNAQAYQWYKNNEEITGATASTYTASSAGSYKVEVQGHSDCTPEFVTSSEVHLNVNQTLSIAAASESQTVCEGQQVILFVEPTASSQSIEWYKNGDLTTYTGGSLTVSTPQDGDVFYAKVTGLCNVVNSGEMVITVKKQPVITAQPTSATICTGNTHTFSVTATHAQGYQWYKNNEEITGATASTYTASSAGSYKVEVQGHSDCTPEFVTSSEVHLNVNQTLSIAAASESQTVCEGQQVILFVEPTASSQSIEWYKNGDLTTYTGGSLTVSTPQDGDVFYAKVTGLCNVVNSGEMVITVKKQPVITAQPTSATICTGNTHTFSVTATNAQAYQWYKNNEEITGATASTYTTSESGTYKVEVKGHSDCTPEFVTSEQVDLTVNQNLSIAAASESQTVCEGQQVILFVEPTGSSQSIEWYKNGDLTTYTGGSVTVTDPQDGDIFYAKVTGSCNVVNSGEMVITVKKQPVITAQPTAATICTGNTHTFSVTATHAQAYQWYKNNEEITGATASTYTTSESGTYKVEVKGHNDCTPEFVMSEQVDLTVNQTLSIAAASESQTVCEGQQVILFVEPNASSQSIEWYKNGDLTTYTGGSLTVTTPQDGDVFYAKVTGLCNVVNSGEMVITVPSTPNFSVSSNKPNGTCGNQTTILTANGCSPDVTWYKDGVLVGTGITFSTNIVGMYKAFCSVQSCDDLPVSDSIRVFEATPMEYSLKTSDVSCFQGNDGEANMVFPNGSDGISVEWLIPHSVFGTSISGLSAGTYTYKVTFQTGCQIQNYFTIKAPSAPLVSYVTKNVSCTGLSNGRIAISLNYEKSNLRYFLNGVQGGWTNGTMEGLLAGTYTIGVLDESGCVILPTTEVIITEPAPVTVALVSAVNPKTMDSNDGYIAADISGGTGAYEVNWFDLTSKIPVGKIQNTYVGEKYRTQLSGIGGSSYRLQVKDQNACEVTGFYELTAPESISINASIRSISCFGISDGIINLEISGGIKTATTLGYNIEWKKGDEVILNNTLRAISLGAGTYHVTVTDANGIVTTKDFILTNPPLLQLTTSNIQDSYCASSPKGAVSLAISGGTLPYLVSFNGAAVIDLSLTGLAAGTYTATVKDGASCVSTKQVIIKESSTDFKVNVAYNSPHCFGACDGSLVATVSGGVAPYTYNWSGLGSDTPSLLEVCAGGKTFVTVTDAAGCVVKSEETALVGPEPIALSLPTEKEVCPSQSFELDASMIPWGTNFLWTFPDGSIHSGAKVTADSLGVYSVQILDDKSCGGVGAIEVVPNKDVNIQFTMPNEAVVNKDIVLVDLSEPYPSLIEWQLPSEGVIVSQKDFEARVTFSEVGNYVIKQLATVDNCVYSFSKTILISETVDDSGFSPSVSYAKLDFEILGNPIANNKLRIRMDNEGEQPFTLKIFNQSGSRKLYDKEYKVNMPQYIDIDLLGIDNEVMLIITIESGKIRRTKKAIAVK